jgi:hypothetical protein
LIAGEESARQVLGQINELRRILPSAKIVLVRNERDGCPVAEAKELPADLRKLWSKRSRAIDQSACRGSG